MSLMLIVTRTPPWVWGLLAMLLALGAAQARTRDLAPRRLATPPLVLAVLALAGVVSTFRADGLALAAALATWASAGAAVLFAGERGWREPQAAWQADTGRLRVPGSMLPLVLIVGLFLIKYAVGVTLALQPGMARQIGFAAAVGAAYGLFGGLFLARARALWRAVPAPAQRGMIGNVPAGAAPR